ncbi:hypothetical protein [Pasteurella bettyae]|uniref:Uncharacterized protein n=1 Tax=Pasteurella bettyae CCUG 2042 TaxID=1095749 RepID=I3DKB9_9PAST|nr:hypothetical protein [Pasteurella bettyae]EIJ72162.1 hypothetical protein HMPREF1052_2056 [Pasteurella bettyae CCUG 2042]SSX47827.1 Uncharacterised protein [Pasteurella bettyae]SUB20789.1 Uncharacterised protein [Pasteurella bettyae]
MDKLKITEAFISELVKDKARMDFIQEHKIEIILERDTGEFQLCRHDNGIIIDLTYDTSLRDGIDRMIEYFKRNG